MASKTSIAWTQATWNCVTGCSKVSPGCAHCYAETLAMTRLVGKPGYSGLPWTPENAATNVVLRPDRLDLPLRWRKPRMVFVNSMSDLFHELVPDDFILSVFDVMNRSTYNGGAGMGRIRDENREGHTFQVLTKRPDRMRAFVSRLRFDPSSGLSLDGPGFQFTNPDIWLGTSVENQHWADVRIPELVQTPAVVRFLSCEPLLGRLSIEPWLWLTGPSTAGPWSDALGRNRGGGGIGGQMMSSVASGDIGWVIVGAESGASRRPYDMTWAREIRDECAGSETAFFYKQSGAFKSGHHPYLTDSDGTCWEWHQYPRNLSEPVRVHASGECAEYGVKQESLAL